MYRLLKEAELIKPREEKNFPAGPEFVVKTKRTNQMWQTDATFLLEDGAALGKGFETCIDFYNSERPYYSLGHKTPDQAYFESLQKTA